MEKNFISKRDEILIQKQSELDPEDKLVIDRGFEKQANASVGHDGAIAHFALTAKRRGALVGALTARFFWGSLHIRHLFVVPILRNNGIGKRLMQAAFEIGIAHQCRFVNIETMSFQAMEFYQKLGFQIDFSRKGYDRDCIFHYLSRNLGS